MTNTTVKTLNRDFSALRAEVESLKSLVLCQNEVVAGLTALSKAQSEKLAEHEEYLQITADALRTLQKQAVKTAPKEQKATKKATAPKEQKATKKATAPKEQKATKKATAPKASGLSWSQLSRDGKKSWNAYAFRSKTYGRSKEAWSRWSVDRLTMVFPKDII